MGRSLAVLAMVGGLLIGCVTINVPGGSTPSLSPSLSPASATPTVAATPTPTPSPSPTQAATATPSAPPTSTPTGTPGPSPTAAATPAGVENYGATTPLINDSFGDPDSGWGIGTNDGGSVTYGDHTLEIAVTGEGAWERTQRLTGATSNAVSAEAHWTTTGEGMAGLLCAANADEYWGATQDPVGNYAFIKLDDQGATVLAQGHFDELKRSADGFSQFALDCAGTATGSFRMQVHPAGTNVGVQYFGAPGEGPAAFDRIGIYAQSAADSYNISADAVIAFGGTGDTSMTPDQVELMSHVPAEWQPKCFDSVATVNYVGVKADILCNFFGGERSDWAEYMSFRTQADMDASFNHLVEKWAVAESGKNCDAGAHQGGYTVNGGQPAGRLLCAPSITGTRFDWTDNAKLILSSLIDLEGSYPDMYQDWLIAGPN